MAFAKFGKAINSLGEHLKQTPVAKAFAESGWRGAGSSLLDDAMTIGQSAVIDDSIMAGLVGEPLAAMSRTQKTKTWAGFAARTPIGYGAAFGAGSGMVFGNDRRHSLGGRAVRGGLLGAGAGAGYMALRHVPSAENVTALKGSWSAFRNGWKAA